ncbi:cob(I)yrinic acid a,c-diamide adenosyltransferase [Hazenella sp. IB182357]|uniref:Corrinoid adenosyltransferase n=1 Tax=Polycladospora coralii TaxID=2771432 RepID=A0A926NCB9_9BACL|nr:cob(I)yrinic acid a,c-diamide adenosyltransferase [Polycladospora coralii]
MKIYTRTGDEGKTALVGGRVSKDDIRVEAYGTIDELNAFVGNAICKMAMDKHNDLRQHLTEIQHELFDAGADLAQVSKKRTYQITADKVTRLENWIDQYDTECAPLQRFILPGGTALAAALHICRVVARRAERRTVTLTEAGDTNVEVRRYLNRLSDFFFIAARVVNVRARVQDIEYDRS